jgi:hypothetical protein
VLLQLVSVISLEYLREYCSHEQTVDILDGLTQTGKARGDGVETVEPGVIIMPLCQSSGVKILDCSILSHRDHLAYTISQDGWSTIGKIHALPASANQSNVRIDGPGLHQPFSEPSTTSMRVWVSPNRRIRFMMPIHWESCVFFRP